MGSSNLIGLFLIVKIVVGVDILLCFLFDVRVFGLADKVAEPRTGN